MKHFDQMTTINQSRTPKHAKEIEEPSKDGKGGKGGFFSQLFTKKEHGSKSKSPKQTKKQEK